MIVRGEILTRVISRVGVIGNGMRIIETEAADRGGDYTTTMFRLRSFSI